MIKIRLFKKTKRQPPSTGWRYDVRMDTARKAALRRDGRQCTVCGSRKNLHAHHIESGSRNEKLRYSVSNLVTLCSHCHLGIGSIHQWLGGTHIPCTRGKYEMWLDWRSGWAKWLKYVTPPRILLTVAVGTWLLVELLR